MRISDVAVLELGATRRELQGLAVVLARRSAVAPATAIEVGRRPGRPASRPTSGSCVASPCTAEGDRPPRRGQVAVGRGGRQRLPRASSAAARARRCSPPTTTSAVVGIVNTTTIGAAAGGSCALGQPCEVGTGRRRRGRRPHATPCRSATWAACWAPTFDIADDGCPAEQPPVVAVDAPLRAVQPGATWAATIENGGPDRPTVVKTGPASADRLP